MRKPVASVLAFIFVAFAASGFTACEPKNVTVTIRTFELAVVAPVVIKNGDTLESLATPIADDPNFTFETWYDGNWNTFDVGKLVTKSITLYAGWRHSDFYVRPQRTYSDDWFFIVYDVYDKTKTSYAIPAHARAKWLDSNLDECVNLKSLVIPDNITEISGTFQGCSSLESVTLPKGITEIPSFSGCVKLDNVVIPDGVTHIGGGGFRDCSDLRSISLPNGLTTIYNNAFYNCAKLDLVLPPALESVGEKAFYGCTSLVYVSLPASVKSVGYRAFSSPYVNIAAPSSAGLIEFAEYAFDFGVLAEITVADSATKDAYAAGALSMYADKIRVR
ncbi:MAG: leucine-rich repeat domain-containing protein [Clostridiales bacterium]|jgi:hypothetical protein|nr:leucine-rich repeat domain-containing protein [Clostridiales bacterium]